eukprot:239341-Alexandrium_andersonii.AAC.1
MNCRQHSRSSPHPAQNAIKWGSSQFRTRASQAGRMRSLALAADAHARQAMREELSNQIEHDLPLLNPPPANDMPHSCTPNKLNELTQVLGV